MFGFWDSARVPQGWFSDTEQQRAWVTPDLLDVSDLSAAQAVPDAALSASLAVDVALSVAQAIPDAVLAASLAVTVKANANQAVPDASLSATAKVIVSTSAGQAVPAVAETATLSVPASFGANQAVDAPTQAASLADVASLGVSQLVDAPTQTATGKFITVDFSGAQAVPDAAMTANAAVLVRANASQAVDPVAGSESLAVHVQLQEVGLEAAPVQSAGLDVIVSLSTSAGGSATTIPGPTQVADLAVTVSASANQAVPPCSQVAKLQRPPPPTPVDDCRTWAYLSHFAVATRAPPASRVLRIPLQVRRRTVLREQRALVVPREQRTDAVPPQ
jgi:hypothetical protein